MQRSSNVCRSFHGVLNQSSQFSMALMMTVSQKQRETIAALESAHEAEKKKLESMFEVRSADAPVFPTVKVLISPSRYCQEEKSAHEKTSHVLERKKQKIETLQDSLSACER